MRRYALAMGLICAGDFAQGDYDGAEWVERFRFAPPEAYAEGVAAHEPAALPSFTVDAPAGAQPQLVRTSLPFPPGALAEGLGVAAVRNGQTIPCDLRVLTYHPGKPRWVRRAMVTFPYTFTESGTTSFTLTRTAAPEAVAAEGPLTAGPLTVDVDADGATLTWNNAETWRATVDAPAQAGGLSPTLEIVERGRHFLWVRVLAPDPLWPRIVEVQADSLGGVSVQAHVQRLAAGDAYAPALGWRIEGPGAFDPAAEHGFAGGEDVYLRAAASVRRVHFPVAPLTRKGLVRIQGATAHYLRSTGTDNIPMQQAAWRRMGFAIDGAFGAGRTGLLEPGLRATAAPEAFDALYDSGAPLDLAPWPDLAALEVYTRDAIVHSALTGDDYGNVTSFNPGGAASVFGMNRLNHCPPIFEESYRSGDGRLRDTAVLWCNNMYDQSIWWGDTEHFGGTRYNNAVAAGREEHKDDTSYMWRTNGGEHTFCTKGYDSFFYAYEETGDPRMAAALRHQAAYAAVYVHADKGEARNIGDAADFVRLYRFTGMPAYEAEALRLFRGLREKLGDDGLFSQSGVPIVADRPFIDDDAMGSKHPFGKPYIIGYGLAGCPWLLEAHPAEPRLAEMVRAVANFQAESVDPAGGWRYPAPESSGIILSQALEHAAQLVRAAQALESLGEDTAHLADAIEIVLQARLQGFIQTGQTLGGLSGWERTTGALAEGETLHDRYAKPADRDRSRDYTEGAIGVGGAPPDGLVYLHEALAYYLSKRPAERLWNTTPALGQVLARLERTGPVRTAEPTAEVETFAFKDLLPVFSERMIDRLEFPMAYGNSGMAFPEWREAARARLLASLGTPPPRGAFDPLVIGEEDRGTHTAYKLALNVNAWERVKAYLLVPKGEGPFPAVLALHDHGAHFTIGKEKVVRPFDEPEARLADAAGWVETYYGGRWFGDALAARGYVVFATDMLYWGDRARYPEVSYEDQQALGANMMQLGSTWAGHILWDDLRCAEFLQSRPEVDPERIGAAGLSVGCYRTWALSAATDIVKAGAAICWMSDTEALFAAGNNQTTGQSAFSTLHPFLRNFMDYPDVASIACPKPMLFHNGTEDGLFPVDSVERAYAKMRGVWESQGAGDKLVTKLWPVPHRFTAEMQDEAFEFLDRWLKE